MLLNSIRADIDWISQNILHEQYNRKTSVVDNVQENVKGTDSVHKKAMMPSGGQIQSKYHTYWLITTLVSLFA